MAWITLVEASSLEEFSSATPDWFRLSLDYDLRGQLLLCSNCPF